MYPCVWVGRFLIEGKITFFKVGFTLANCTKPYILKSLAFYNRALSVSLTKHHITETRNRVSCCLALTLDKVNCKPSPHPLVSPEKDPRVQFSQEFGWACRNSGEEKSVSLTKKKIELRSSIRYPGLRIGWNLVSQTFLIVAKSVFMYCNLFKISDDLRSFSYFL